MTKIALSWHQRENRIMNLPELNSILFLDIECVSTAATYHELSPEMQYLWREKAARLIKQYDAPLDDEAAAQVFIDKAGIFSEYGKIVCISVGFFHKKEGVEVFKLNSYYGDDEVKLLKEFADLLDNKLGRIRNICGHNIKEFDIPYICRRMVINGLELPAKLQISGKKPWDLNYLVDTMDAWRFGDRKNFTPLKLLTALFGIPSPKSDIDGSQVGRVYWEDGQVERIAAYCERDVLATAQLVRKFKRMNLLPEENIMYSVQYDIDA